MVTLSGTLTVQSEQAQAGIQDSRVGIEPKMVFNIAADDAIFHVAGRALVRICRADLLKEKEREERNDGVVICYCSIIN